MANAWKQVGNIKGADGAQGPEGKQGPQGVAGKSVRVASIDVTGGSDVAFSALSPSDGVAVGDTVVDAHGDVYTVASVNAEASTAHVGNAIEGVTLKGPKGDQGIQGPKGEDGTSITVKGSVATSAELPADAAIGDTYVTSSDGHMWVKTSEADPMWTDLGEMKGPKGDKGEQGDPGAQGERGVQGPQGEAGPGISFGSAAPSGEGRVGAVYVDTQTWNVYSYGESE